MVAAGTGPVWRARWRSTARACSAAGTLLVTGGSADDAR